MSLDFVICQPILLKFNSSNINSGNFKRVKFEAILLICLTIFVFHLLLPL